MTSTEHARAIRQAAAAVFAEWQTDIESWGSTARASRRQIDSTDALDIDDLSAVIAEARTLIVDEASKGNLHYEDDVLGECGH